MGNADAETLSRYGAAYIGDTDEKVLCLTFDAGYENGYTAHILDVLREHNIPAVSFLVGPYIRRNPELVKRMVAEGHIVGNHNEHHWDISRISDRNTFINELEPVEDSYRNLTGKELPRFYRPPQGIYSEKNLSMAHDLGYHTVFWSLAHMDWDNESQPTREQVMSKLIPRIHPGAVILLHATSKSNSELLPELLSSWEKAGYRFGTWKNYLHTFLLLLITWNERRKTAQKNDSRRSCIMNCNNGCYGNNLCLFFLLLILLGGCGFGQIGGCGGNFGGGCSC